MPEAGVRAAIARCQRDGAELPLVECIQRFQAPLWRLEREAERRHSSSSPLRRDLESRLLAERLVETLLSGAIPQEPEIAAYLDQHKSEWQTPERIRLFRILVADKKQAESLIASLAHATPADFRAQARAHSLDKTSHERGGDLGFVAADGTTDLPSVHVDPALYAAAKPLGEGAFVPKPVPEGPHFAVVWRRGSLPAHRLTAAEARTWASGRLAELAAGGEVDRLVQAQKPELHVDLLARFRRDDCRLFER